MSGGGGSRREGPDAGTCEHPNKKLIRRLLAAADRGDVEELTTLYTADYWDHVNSDAPTGTDRDDTLAAQRRFAAAFPDAKHTIHELIAEDDKVVLRVSVSGTHTGALGGVEPTGRVVSMTSTVIYRVAADRVAERWCDNAWSIREELSRPESA